jgi:hypothetical protein
VAVPGELALTAAKDQAVSGTLILTAQGGPVTFVIHSSSLKVTVSPASGRLKSAGSWITVTVTAKSLVTLDTHLTVNPGKLIITVLLHIKK